MFIFKPLLRVALAIKFVAELVNKIQILTACTGQRDRTSG
jgi:hypothetical protein